ncbi:unnamed protein product [Clonostachys rosea]|uniref:Uncharacterized protein n=1 Tax=Bionectria ochroleuca TaxID=29856 RepID=A0ABY6UDJ7_BIOOC|nr:unnamed protein product [Clonostachys rosea]
MLSPISFLRRHYATCLLATSAIVGHVEAATKIKGGADPSIMKYDGNYYSAGTCGSSSICVRKAAAITDLGGDAAVSKTVWSDKNGLTNIWAPEIMIDGGKTYIYFTGGASDAHRMYYIVADSPQGTYSAETKINLPGDGPAIDGIVFTFENQRWMVWSGWTAGGDGMQTLYICKMSSPTTATGGRYVISQPKEPWEQTVGKVNEAPTAIVDPNGQLHIVYSANGSWSDKYCLGEIRLKKGGDPTYVWDWYKSNGCLFGSNQADMMSGWDATLSINGPGSHTFQLDSGDVRKSPGGSNRIPFVFHGVPKGTAYSWGARNWYTGSFVWWGSVKYHRANVPGDNDNVGYGFKFFE